MWYNALVIYSQDFSDYYFHSKAYIACAMLSHQATTWLDIASIAGGHLCTYYTQDALQIPRRIQVSHKYYAEISDIPMKHSPPFPYRFK